MLPPQAMVPPQLCVFVTSRHRWSSTRRYTYICASKVKAHCRYYILRQGSLVIYKINNGMERAFHNLPSFMISEGGNNNNKRERVRSSRRAGGLVLSTSGFMS